MNRQKTKCTHTIFASTMRWFFLNAFLHTYSLWYARGRVCHWHAVNIDMKFTLTNTNIISSRVVPQPSFSCCLLFNIFLQFFVSFGAAVVIFDHLPRVRWIFYSIAHSHFFFSSVWHIFTVTWLLILSIYSYFFFGYLPVYFFSFSFFILVHTLQNNRAVSQWCFTKHGLNYE